MSGAFRKFCWLFKRGSKEDQLDAELEFHLSEEVEELKQTGLSDAEAQWESRRHLGNLGSVREQTRAAWSWTALEQFIQDLRYAARTALRSPAFTILATLSLALGIGANTAIYSFMDALLLRSLPVSDPASLVVLNWHIMGKKSVDDSPVHTVNGFFYDDPKTGKTAPIFPYPAFELLRKSTNALSVLFAYRPAGKLNVITQGQPGMASGEYVSGDYFRGLRLVSAAGRLIDADDDRAAVRAVAVLSYGFGQRRFGDPASAAGRQVLINNVPFTAIGIAPPGFFGVNPAAAPDFYVPMHANLLLTSGRGPFANPARDYLDDHHYWIQMMGRLNTGVTIAGAQAALGQVFAGWVSSTATNDKERANLPEFLLKPGAGGLDDLRRKYSRPLYVLLTMVALILAIACANIANLLLARAAARRREMAIRLSIGAGRWRVIRQLLTESLLLAATGGAAGILFAMWGIRFLTLLLANGNGDFTFSAELNWHVLGAAAALTTITGLVFGLTPAIQATRSDVTPALRETRAAEWRSRGGGRIGLSRILVAAQIAISLLLLIGAGLFVRTLSALQSIEMGFQRQNLLTFTVNARQVGHQDPEIISFYQDLQARFAAIPGVRSATTANSPLLGAGAWAWPVVPLGKQPPEKAPTGRGFGAAAAATHVLATGPEFFRTMQIPLLTGRDFDLRDRPGSSPVAIVNQAWVKANLGDVDPIGQRIVSSAPRMKPLEMEIIGVAKNARYDELKGDFPAVVYMAFAQNLSVPVEEMTFLLRTASDPLAYADTVHKIVREADARIPVTNLGTEAAQIDQEMGQQILFARLCSVFAMLALAIACVGLYATMSYTVARRTGEIGIRMALGARRGTVVWMVLRDALILAVLGLAASLPVGLGASKLLESLLFGVKPNDPWTLAVAAAILFSAVLLAGYLPARKASRIDPITALRHE
jgi:predicted permease